MRKFALLACLLLGSCEEVEGNPDPFLFELDRDDDGVPNDEDNCQFLPNPDQTDTDEDGLGDACDDDSDEDGFSNGEDNCPNSPNADQVDSNDDGFGDACGWEDFDEDGVSNDEDNCSRISNPEQANIDEDGLGDVCDLDNDNDGLPDVGDYRTGPAQDMCPFTPWPEGHEDGDRQDVDMDGLGDNCDPDADGDGIPNFADDCPYYRYECSTHPHWGTPIWDSDKDGIKDTYNGEPNDTCTDIFIVAQGLICKEDYCASNECTF